MKKPRSVGEKLAALNALREEPWTDESTIRLRRFLSDRSNHVVQRAADIAGETLAEAVVPDLLQAHARLMTDPADSDPGCLGKSSIVRALVKLDHDDVDFYRDGIAYEQPEPVWGGERDTAAELRAVCALGLIGRASGIEVLNRCAVLLADPCVEARAGAARAIAALGQPDGGPLLRLKLLSGDANAEVMGECCSALLRLCGAEGMDVVTRLLSSADPDLCVQAALALGESRRADALDPLTLAWKRQPSPDTRGDLLICIGLLRLSKSEEFLLSLIGGDDLRVAADALKSLKVHGTHAELRRRVEAAVEAAQDRRLDEILLREWGIEN